MMNASADTTMITYYYGGGFAFYFPLHSKQAV
jgi:hypothetical protein